MMLEFKTVDCNSGAELPYGYVNKDVIYNGGSLGKCSGWQALTIGCISNTKCCWTHQQKAM